LLGGEWQERVGVDRTLALPFLREVQCLLVSTLMSHLVPVCWVSDECEEFSTHYQRDPGYRNVRFTREACHRLTELSRVHARMHPLLCLVNVLVTNQPSKESARAGSRYVVVRAARFLAAFAAFNHDDPVALHGAGRTADKADDIIGSASAARTRFIIIPTRRSLAVCSTSEPLLDHF
jgi:hypothetical protein